ncbi:hypothetical protein ABDD95_07795 [Mucilaginibacter sp. PAMB04274]|uniref:hypothetical protein n=1 Tax=Mucilaginibacter sp. PAMB04274 TaxID=3138568 RepID=UPI0031F610D6
MVDQLVVKRLTTEDLSIELVELDGDELHERSEWIPISSWINLIVKEAFITNHFKKKSVAFTTFMQEWESIFSMFKGDGKERSPLNDYPPLSIWYVTHENIKLRFLLTHGSKERLKREVKSAFETIYVLNKSRKSRVKSVLKTVFAQSDHIKYLRFIEDEWQVINPIFEESSRISRKYLQENDYRIKKPWIVFQKNNLHQYKITNNNWVLEFDNLETLMLQPNDVAIYSSISDQNLNFALSFYNETILPRHKYYHGMFPHVEQQQEYFTYFQFIITSLIFAYTALEAFANICIPDNYSIEEEKQGIKTIYSKTGIERTFTLRDKFKRVLTEVLQTTEPSQEKWWSKFITLEKLRNEIIHTKQSSSDGRYSTLLSKNIFDMIKVHKTIISYYGHYINLNKPELLEEFPYQFGYDDVVAGLSDSPEFDSWTVDHKMHKAFFKAKGK